MKETIYKCKENDNVIKIRGDEIFISDALEEEWLIIGIPDLFMAIIEHFKNKKKD